MNTILYSMAGEGRGHATRVRSLIEDLRGDFKIILYAPGQAYDLLKPVYENSDIEVKKIPGLQWFYNRHNRLNYPKSAVSAFKYIKNLPGLIDKLCIDIEKYKPDLIISDFDPALPRAAKKCRVPFISFDHQHFLTTYDLSSLPMHLKVKALFMKPFVNFFCNGQNETVVSSFYFPPVKKGENIKQIGVLINKELMNITPEKGDYLLVYLRRFTYVNVQKALLDCGYPVKIYGLGKQKSILNLTFHEIDYYRFIEDLAGARALLSTAGNQLIGEALYLGKPVIAIPEPGNFEQEINAHFLQQSGSGLSTTVKEISGFVIKQFLIQNDYHRLMINRRRMCGNNDAIRIINNYLNTKNSSRQKSRISAREQMAVS